MIDKLAVSDVLGTIGTILWCLQIVPQLIKNHRSQSTFGLSPWLLIFWATASILQGAYFLIEWVNLPLLVQPQIFIAFALIGVGQCLYFRDGGEQIGLKLSRSQTKILVLGTWAVSGAVEFAFFELGRLGKRRGTDAASQVFGVLGVIAIVGGLLPQYWEIYKLREVVGISLLLLLIDSAGAVFSLLALMFKPSFDGLAASNYIGVLVLELGIFALHLVLNPYTDRLRRSQQFLEKGSDQACNLEQHLSTEDTLALSERAPNCGPSSPKDIGGHELEPTSNSALRKVNARSCWFADHGRLWRSCLACMSIGYPHK